MKVAIAVIPRERFSFTKRSLEGIYENTRHPFDLVYVDGASPPATRDYIAAAAEKHGFKRIRTEHILTPNEARNLALSEIDTEYVVFIDNDALASPGWLGKLVSCADDTGAWVVGPLYLEGSPGSQRVHMAGGDARIVKGDDGKRYFRERHRFAHQPLGAVRTLLRREPVELVEFHCMLVRTDVFQKLGPLDEGLMSVHEHCDLCLLVRGAGGTVYLEPDAVVTYVAPPPFESGDRPFYLMRWSPDWNDRSLKRFIEKWNLAPGSLREMGRWLSHHRRIAYNGMKPWGRPLEPLITRFITREEVRRRRRALRA